MKNWGIGRNQTQDEVNFTDGPVAVWNIMKACGKQHMLL